MNVASATYSQTHPKPIPYSQPIIIKEKIKVQIRVADESIVCACST